MESTRCQVQIVHISVTFSAQLLTSVPGVRSGSAKRPECDQRAQFEDSFALACGWPLVMESSGMGEVLTCVFPGQFERKSVSAIESMMHPTGRSSTRVWCMRMRHLMY